MNHDELRIWSKHAADWAHGYHAGLRERPVRAPLIPGAIAALTLLSEKLDDRIGCGCLALDTCTLWNPGDRARGFGLGPRYLFGNSLQDPLPETILAVTLPV